MENQKNTIFEMTPPGRVNECAAGYSRDGMTFRLPVVADLRDFTDLSEKQKETLVQAVMKNTRFRIRLKPSEGVARIGESQND